MAETILTLSNWQFALTLGLFVAVSGGETLWSMRTARRSNHVVRWTANIALYALGFGIVMLAAPHMRGIVGVLAAIAPFPPLVGLGMHPVLIIVISVLIIDLLAYLSHLISHLIPILWRLHRTHHSDRVVDGSTGVRHHPFETIVAATLMTLVFGVLGLPLLVILAYGLIGLVWQFWTHLDVALPEGLDRPMRAVLVTPSMHRVHHSTDMREGNSNFGQVLSIWDHLFGTYQHRSTDQRADMTFGVEGFSPGSGPGGPLLEPFRRQGRS